MKYVGMTNDDNYLCELNEREISKLLSLGSLVGQSNSYIIHKRIKGIDIEQIVLAYELFTALKIMEKMKENEEK